MMIVELNFMPDRFISMKRYSINVLQIKQAETIRLIDVAIVLNFLFAFFNLISDPNYILGNLLILAPFCTAIVLLIIRLKSDLSNRNTAFLILTIYLVLIILEYIQVGIPSLSSEYNRLSFNNKGVLLQIFINMMPLFYVLCRVAIIFVLGSYLYWTIRLDNYQSKFLRNDRNIRTSK